jgi:hypothetical protein
MGRRRIGQEADLCAVKALRVLKLADPTLERFDRPQAPERRNRAKVSLTR